MLLLRYDVTKVLLFCRCGCNSIVSMMVFNADCRLWIIIVSINFIIQLMVLGIDSLNVFIQLGRLWTIDLGCGLLGRNICAANATNIGCVFLRYVAQCTIIQGVIELDRYYLLSLLQTSSWGFITFTCFLTAGYVVWGHVSRDPRWSRDAWLVCLS